MNITALAPRAPIDIDRRAAALADVHQMHDELTDAQAVVLQLRADLHREEDRCAMIVEERDRYRTESARFRKLLIELATQLSNIGLMTTKAQEIVRLVDDLDAAPTLPLDKSDA
jgi:hypothetical protein